MVTEMGLKSGRPFIPNELKVCDTEETYMPAQEQAENHGYGAYLITSAFG